MVRWFGSETQLLTKRIETNGVNRMLFVKGVDEEKDRILKER